MDHLGNIGSGLVRGHLGVGDQNDDVVFVHQVRGRAVDPDDAGATFASDGVGLQACAVGDVHDRNELAGQDVGSVQQGQVHSDGANVVQIGVRDGGPVDFGLEHFAKHRLPGHYIPWKDPEMPAAAYMGEGPGAIASRVLIA